MEDAQHTRVAVYERRVAASLERVWENVLDWEHLPWLHGGSFQTIACHDAGPWGWRARVAMEPAGEEAELELLVEREAGRYVTRTLSGRAAGSEIWTTLRSLGEHGTRVSVAFEIAGVPASLADRVGRGYVRLYARLWDEDEEMMRARERELGQLRHPKRERELGQLRHPKRERELGQLRHPKRMPGDADLGPVDALRARLPLEVRWAGRRFRIVETGGALVAHAAVCPHMLGPLDEGAVEDGHVRCPWHGYRFDLRTRRCAQTPALRLPPAPCVTVDAAGSVRLEAPEPQA